MNTIIVTHSTASPEDIKILLAIYIVVSVLSLMSVLISSIVDYIKHHKNYSLWDCFCDIWAGEGTLFSFYSVAIFILFQIFMVIALLVKWVITLI